MSVFDQIAEEYPKAKPSRPSVWDEITEETTAKETQPPAFRAMTESKLYDDTARPLSEDVVKQARKPFETLQRMGQGKTPKTPQEAQEMLWAPQRALGTTEMLNQAPVTQPEPGPLTKARSKISFSNIGKIVPYTAIQGLRGITSILDPILGPLGTTKVLEDAAQYWKPDLGTIPNVGVGFDEKGKLGIQKSQADVADILGATASGVGAVAGPVRATLTAGELITNLPAIEKAARPFYRNILRGMIGGALLGEGKLQDSLSNAALFGMFETAAYAPKIPQAIRNSAAWRSATVKERGLALQSLEDVIKARPDMTEAEILRTWNNPTWMQEAIGKRIKGEVGPETRPEAPSAETKPTVFDEISKEFEPKEAELREAEERFKRGMAGPEEAELVEAEDKFKESFKGPEAPPPSEPPLTPAIEADGKTFTGEPGETHLDVLKANKLESGERIFIDPQGNKLTREEAKQYIKTNHSDLYDAWVKQNPEGEFGEVHTEDLNKAIESEAKDAAKTGEKQTSVERQREGTGPELQGHRGDRDITPGEPPKGGGPSVSDSLPKKEGVGKEEEKAVKEPWQMTLDEYSASGGNRGVGKKEGTPKETGYLSDEEAKKNKIDNNVDGHKYLIKQALSEGKPVPPEVLAEYPDLKAPQSPISGKKIDTQSRGILAERLAKKRTRKWTTDYGKTWHEEAKVGDEIDLDNFGLEVITIETAEVAKNLPEEETKLIITDIMSNGKSVTLERVPKAPTSPDLSGKVEPPAPKGEVGGEAGKVEPTAPKEVVPEPKPAKEPPKPLKNISLGKEVDVSTPRTPKVPVQYAVTDINDLITSHDNALNINPAYPQELQPRNRTRLASEEQIGKIVNKVNPELLGENPMAQYGAPIISDTGIVLSGNARAIALRRIFKEKQDQAKTYREWLKSNAEKFGIDPKDITDNSVLTRVNRSDMDLSKLTQESNEEAIATMSPSEQAMTDAKKITPSLMDVFAPNDEGNLLVAPNREFVRGFLRDVAGPNEINALTTKEGELSQAGVNRIRNALFAKVYEDVATLEKLAESTDNNVRNITNGMIASVPKMAKMKQGIEDDRYYPVDISGDITKAMQKLADIRNQGITYQDYLNQLDMFDNMGEDAKQVLDVFDRYARSPKKIAEFLNTYADIVMKSPKPDKNQIDLFTDLGENIIPNKASVLDAAETRMEELYGTPKETAQATLFPEEPTSGGPTTPGKLQKGFTPKPTWDEPHPKPGWGPLVKEEQVRYGAIEKEYPGLLEEISLHFKEDLGIKGHDLKDAIASFESIGSQLSFELSGSAGKVSPEAKAGARAYQVVGHGFAEDLIQNGSADYRGRVIEKPSDLAQLAQVFRNPKFETLRIFYTKGNKIVGHEGFTSKVPGYVSLVPGKDATQMTKRILPEIKVKMERLGADGFWTVHNHPSGSVKPSAEDTNIHQFLDEKLGLKLKGGIIINGGKYGLLKRETRETRGVDRERHFFIDATEHELPGAGPDKLLKPSIDHPLIGMQIFDPSGLATLSSKLKTEKGMVTAIYLSGQNTVRGIQEVPLGLFKNYKGMVDYFRGRIRDFGSSNVVPVFAAGEFIPKLVQNTVKQGILNGHILDAGQIGEPKSARQADPTILNAPVAGFFAKEAVKSFRVAEPIDIETSKKIDTPINISKNPEFLEAVKNTPGAKITDEGLIVDVSRFQKQIQEGEQSLRTGVFYLPQKDSPQRSYYTRPSNQYGGKQKIEGQTLLKNPLVVKAATGGRGPQIAYDEVLGKGAYEKMRSDVLKRATGGWNKRATIDDIENVLSDFGGDPNLAHEIKEYSREGNLLAYAIQENIVANTVRDFGHDSILSYYKRKGEWVLSELFDLREDAYPTAEGDFSIHPDFRVAEVSELYHGSPHRFDRFSTEKIGTGALKSKLTDESGSINIDMLTPGYVSAKGAVLSAKNAVQSLALPTAKSPAHLRAAEVLGSKLGSMNRSLETSARALKKYHKMFTKMGAYNPNVPLEESPGMKVASDISMGRRVDPVMADYETTRQREFDKRIDWLEKAGAPMQKVREHYFEGMWTEESRKAFNQAVAEIVPTMEGKPPSLEDWEDDQKAAVKQRVQEILKEGGKGSNKSALSYLTKRPLKGKESFRKGKKIDDIMTGIEFGLIPISRNPVDLDMLKLTEMDRSIMANRALREWEKSGDVGEIAADKLFNLPEGWEKLNDKYGTIWGGKSVPVWKMLQELAKTGKQDLYFAGFGKEMMPSALDVAMGADDTMKEEANGLTWVNEKTGKEYNIHAMKRGTGKSYSQLVLEKLLKDHEAFEAQAPTIYEKLQQIAGNSQKMNDILGTPTFQNLQQKLPVGGLVIRGYRVAKKPVAEIVNNYLSSSLYNNEVFGPAYRAWMLAANKINQFQLSMGSAFHAGFTTAEVQISANAEIINDVYGLLRGNRTAKDLANTIGKATIATGRTAWMGGQIVDEFRNPEAIEVPTNVPVGMLPQDRDHRIAMIAKAAELAGGGFTMEKGLWTQTTEKMVQNWYGGEKVKAALRSPFALPEMSAYPIMTWLVPKQKAGVFGNMVGRTIEMNPDKTMEELTPQFRQKWNRIDARLGQVRYGRLFLKNWVKEFAQGVIRAPGWTGGTIAETIVGAPVDTVKFFAEWVKTGKLPPNIPDRVSYTMSLLITVTLLNGLLTYLFTGERPSGMDYWAFRDGGQDKYGKPTRLLLPTYVKDLFAFYQDFGHVVLAKTHPLVSLSWDMAKFLTNKPVVDYYGVERVNPEDPFIKRTLDMGKHTASIFIPFYMRGMAKTSEEEGGFFETLKESPEKIIAPEFGIMPATSAYTSSGLEKYVQRLKQKHPYTTTPEKKEKSDLMHGLESGLRRDKDDAKDKLGDAVLDEQITAKDKKLIEKRAKMDPLIRAISTSRMTWKEMAVGIDKYATKEEKEMLKPIFTKKYEDAKKENGGKMSEEDKDLYYEVKDHM